MLVYNSMMKRIIFRVFTDHGECQLEMPVNDVALRRAVVDRYIARRRVYEDDHFHVCFCVPFMASSSSSNFNFLCKTSKKTHDFSRGMNCVYFYILVIYIYRHGIIKWDTNSFMSYMVMKMIFLLSIFHDHKSVFI